jgi:hypothetical protein
MKASEFQNSEWLFPSLSHLNECAQAACLLRFTQWHSMGAQIQTDQFKPKSKSHESLWFNSGFVTRHAAGHLPGQGLPMPWRAAAGKLVFPCASMKAVNPQSMKFESTCSMRVALRPRAPAQASQDTRAAQPVTQLCPHVGCKRRSRAPPRQQQQHAWHSRGTAWPVPCSGIA